MLPIPDPAFYAEKQRLISEFTVAVSAYLQAQSEQLKLVVLADGFGFEDQIKATAKRKDQAKHAILKHGREHGC